ncbi:MAG: hypothetical protein ACI9H8_001200 [Lysobacterales bacterium]
MLFLSLLALFVGPLLYHRMQRGGLIAKALDRSIVIAMVIVVFFLLVPEAFEGLGWIALLLIAAGYLLPGALETVVRKSAHTFHLISMLLALVGFALHAMLDGAGLAGSSLQSSGNLALVIVLHRLGAGLVIWLIVQPAFGYKVALTTLTMIALVTVVGFYLSEQMLPFANQDSTLIIQSLIIGTIMHSLVHRGHVTKAD